MLILLLWIGVTCSTTFACLNVPLKRITVNKKDNVITANVEKKYLFDVVHSNDYNFILKATNLNDVCLSNPDGDTALHEAVNSKSTESLEALLIRGVDVDLKDGKGRTALLPAVRTGNVEALNVLYDQGADLNETIRGGCKERNRTLMHEAAIWGQDKAASWLSMMNLDKEARECDGWTPMHWAAFRGHPSVLDVLTRGGANVNVKSDFGSTPLHWAVVGGHIDTVFDLVQWGAFTDAADDEGWTPLHRAAQYDRMQISKLLVSNGASLTAKTQNGWTPLAVAHFWHHKELSKFLAYSDVTDPLFNNQSSNRKDQATGSGSIINLCLLIYLPVIIFN